MKKLFQIIITCVTLIILFFNHYDLNYKCLEWSNGSSGGFEEFVKTQEDSQDMRTLVENKCVKSEEIPTIVQDNLNFKTQAFPDIFTLLIYSVILYFTKDLSFKKKKNISQK